MVKKKSYFKFNKNGIDRLILSETKKKGKEKIQLEEGHVLYFSGVLENSRASAGVSCVIMKGNNTTIIATYSSNEDATKEIKDTFWEKLAIVTRNSKSKIYVANK